MFLSAAINFTDIKSYENIYKDVYIDTKNSVVLDRNLKPIYETLYENIYWWKGALHGGTIRDPELRRIEVQRRYEEILKQTLSITEDDVLEAKELGDDVEAIYAMHPHGWYPYGHLHDSLLRLFPWRNHDFKKPKVLVSKNHRVVDFSAHLKAFGFSEDAVFHAAPEYRLIKVKKLYYGVSESRFWTTSTQQQYDWMIDGYMSLFDKDPRDLQPIEGLYLSRNHIGRRGVLNNEDVQEYLVGRGYQVLTGEESLMEMISLFARAKNIVGPHGSIFVNTIFCRESAKIIEFCPENRRDLSFCKKTKSAQDYSHILLPADSDFNIEINLEKLERFLAGDEYE